MLYTDINNLDHDPKLAQALGNMLVAWSDAEAALSVTMAVVLGIKKNMAFVGYYRIPTFEARVKFLQGIVEQWEPTNCDKAAILDAIDKLSSLSVTRNGYVHHIWGRSSDGKETVIFTLRGKEDKRRKPVKAHDVEQHAQSVRDRTRALRQLLPER